MDIGKEVGGR